ncbi:hypothetical protein UFOVP273_119 [uncultured Caudovirales phage]|uniref:Uncharacterized protein n=1 Tax=uncultured Caudovirales phage TaxID=2100421 RepID=A0A6J5LNB9_9CAUD|nr:hypothetical protein UFOVP273_119 [uncultured Caudovirales phage]
MQIDNVFSIRDNTYHTLVELSKNDEFIDIPANFCLDIAAQEAYNQFIDSEIVEMNQDDMIFCLD